MINNQILSYAFIETYLASPRINYKRVLINTDIKACTYFASATLFRHIISMGTRYDNTRETCVTR